MVNVLGDALGTGVVEHLSKRDLKTSPESPVSPSIHGKEEAPYEEKEDVGGPIAVVVG